MIGNGNKGSTLKGIRRIMSAGAQPLGGSTKGAGGQ